MRKRIYIVISVLLFFFGAYFGLWLFYEMVRFVLTDYPFTIAVRLLPNPNESYFTLPFGLACAAVPIAFMIIRNHCRAIVVVILSFAGAVIALLAIRYLIHSQSEGRSSGFFSVHSGAKGLHLEIVPWVSLAITVLGGAVLKSKGKKISQQGAPADAKRPRR